MFGKITLILAAMSILAAPALGQSTAANVSGPVPAPDVPGSPSHNYIFFSSNRELAAHGYVEEEFVIKGTASRFTTPESKTGAVQDTGHPYETRIVVRRPLDPKRFNGTAIVEWDNVTNQFDAENVWFFDWEDMMRAGYVWVGVSPQHIGVDALKKWSPVRYGDFNVSLGSPPAQGEDADTLSYDIFSQAGAELKHPGSVDMLHGLKPKVFIAAGESQSAGRLFTYVNSIHPLARVYDGFLLLSGGGRIREDLLVPVFKISTEHDVAVGADLVRQPDTAMFRSWEVAGTSHVDQHLRAGREPLELRDNGISLEAAMAPQCAVPQVGTRVPTTYVVASAFDKLRRWAAGGPPPPSAPEIQVDQLNPRPAQSVIGRDKDGLALGGIRLAQLAVPTQINYGLGKPFRSAIDSGIRGEAIGAGACVRWGYSLDMTAEHLALRYPSHATYVAAVRKVTEAALKDGYILNPDADETIHEAQVANIGR